MIRPSQHCCLLTYQAALSTLLFAHLPSCLKLTIPYSTLIRPSDTIVSSPTMLPEADHHTLNSVKTIWHHCQLTSKLPKAVPYSTLIRPSDTIVCSPTKLPEADHQPTNVNKVSHTICLLCHANIFFITLLSTCNFKLNAVHHCTHAR